MPGLAGKLAAEFLAREKADRRGDAMARLTAFGSVYGTLALAAYAFWLGAWWPAAVVGAGAAAASPHVSRLIGKVIGQGS